MKAALGPEQLAFLAELRAYLDGLEPELIEATRAENIADPMQPSCTTAGCRTGC